jgi:hypothetical protein
VAGLAVPGPGPGTVWWWRRGPTLAAAVAGARAAKVPGTGRGRTKGGRSGGRGRVVAGDG